MWSAVCSSAPHLQTAVGAIPHLCTIERNKPTPVQRRLSLTQDVPGRYIPSRLGMTSGKREVLPCHSVFHLVSTQHATLVHDLKKSFKRFSAAGINGCLDLSCRCPLQGGKKSLC